MYVSVPFQLEFHFRLFEGRNADHLLQKSLSRDQNVGEIFNYHAVVFDVDLPLTSLLFPKGADNTMVIFYIAVQVPFLGHFLHIGPDFRACREELAPVWIGIEWKCLFN